MAKTGKGLDVGALSFEAALAELEKIVRQLEDGKGKLEDSIEAYERGAALKKHCETKLSEAKAKVDRITLGAGGAVAAESVDID